MWSYPWSSAALVPMSILGAVLHVLVFIAVLGFARSGLAGPSRSAHIGLFLALAGTALLFVGELASIPVRDQRVDDTGATIVGAIFGIGVLLSAVGFIAAGLATARAGLWQSWRRFTPLATGISICGVLGLNSSTRSLQASPSTASAYSRSLSRSTPSRSRPRQQHCRCGPRSRAHERHLPTSVATASGRRYGPDRHRAAAPARLESRPPVRPKRRRLAAPHVRARQSSSASSCRST